MSRLKKSWIVVANVALMAAILVFVALYSNHEKNENYEHQVEHFVNTTVAMERVTENYLEGEQAICNNWAHYINSSDMTLEEAAAYVRATHAQTTVSGHLIDAETLQGYSSRPRPNTEDDYSVSYQRIELLGDGSWIADVGTAINIVMSAKNDSMTAPVVYMWCAHTVTDSAAIDSVASTSVLYPKIGLRLKTGKISETMPKNGRAMM